MGKALYRTHRSRSLDEIVGQEHVTTILKSAIDQERVGHAYLFTGPRGVGKTSIARILAHEINDLPYSDESAHLDIIEIDAASNNGVDDIRDLREKVSLAPSSARRKIYIIDEVHMLSKQAFNALLKTLEEPPEHVVFILATTDADKLPETIISRTQRFTFKLASSSDIIKNLTRIANAESIAIDETALALIADHSGGSYRDSVSLLDQLQTISTDTITESDIENALGLAPRTQITSLLTALNESSFDHSMQQLKTLLSLGVQPTIIATQMIQMIQSSIEEYAPLLSLSEKLIMVRQSSMPEAQLIAAVGASMSHEPKKRVTQTVAATSLAPVEIPALAKMAEKEHPKEKTPQTKKTSESEPKKDKIAKKDKSNTSSRSPVDWSDVLSDTSSLSIGLRTVLAKCSLEAATSDTVIIYSRNEFYKKKLDTPKYRQELFSLLKEKTGEDWEFDIRPEQAPSKNQTIAEVAAMMGGGEEVSVD